MKRSQSGVHAVKSEFVEHQNIETGMCFNEAVPVYALGTTAD